jgi:membrane glycosyltransferase
MNPNTLYYTLSAMPQVIGAIGAILATFTFFRIANLREYLVGDGKSVLNRWDETGYCFPDPQENLRQKKRLIDAIARRSIPEIKNVIFRLQEIEKKEGFTKKDRPTGLQYVYEDRFCGTERHIINLRRWILFVVALTFVTIIVSIVSLALTDNIISATSSDLKYWVLGLNVFLFIVSLICSFYLMLLGFSEKTVHETDRQPHKKPG